MYSLNGRSEFKVIDQQQCPHFHGSQVNQDDASPASTEETVLTRRLVALRNVGHDQKSKVVLEITKTKHVRLSS